MLSGVGGTIVVEHVRVHPTVDLEPLIQTLSQDVGMVVTAVHNHSNV